jgi:hypothetical protein
MRGKDDVVEESADFWIGLLKKHWKVIVALILGFLSAVNTLDFRVYGWTPGFIAYWLGSSIGAWLVLFILVAIPKALKYNKELEEQEKKKKPKKH